MDVDGDGVSTAEDVCPWLANPDQNDADGDGKGDLCDLCPEEPNPGDTPCSLSVSDIRDPDSSKRPDEGTSVLIEGLAVTGIRAGTGFYVQDPSADVYGGLFVYDGGDYSSGSVSLGDLVNVAGVYSEYYGLSQLASATVTSVGTAPEVVPIPIEDACSVGTEGALGEQYESMLVRVSAVSVTDSNPDAPDDYGEFEVDGCLRVDDQLSEVLIPQPAVGTGYSALSGVLTYTYGHTKLEPRGAEDVTE